ncbi:MAG TPA: ergothioneine biosynthesis protein EgtC [Cyanothece sp. UBA12306]|nr:ergothioneine biosynthesis protein EgtC [Cyanothece sp. UBA12306]
MCRLLAYFGSSIQPEQLIYQAEHSLYLQSYNPKETVTTSVNADGFGIGWYDFKKDIKPFIYKNILPIWSDINFPYLTKYIETKCFLSYIRSATPGQETNLSNCQPFSNKNLLFTHNGFIENFRETLYKPIRDSLTDEIYRKIEGTTDSEHIFALFLNELNLVQGNLQLALENTLNKLETLGKKYNNKILANIIVSNGEQLVACRFAINSTAPSLYRLNNSNGLNPSIIIASEPLFSGDWSSFEDHSLYCYRLPDYQQLSTKLLVNHQ